MFAVESGVRCPCSAVVSCRVFCRLSSIQVQSPTIALTTTCTISSIVARFGILKRIFLKTKTEYKSHSHCYNSLLLHKGWGYVRQYEYT